MAGHDYGVYVQQEAPPTDPRVPWDENYYAVLHLQEGATKSEITRSYRDLARQWHPDKAHPDDRKLCEAKFKELHKAYECLTTKDKRETYDAFLAAVEGGRFDQNWEEFQSWSKCDPTFIQSLKLQTFKPKSSDISLLLGSSLGVCAGWCSYLVWKLFFSRSHWLQEVPWQMSFHWAEVTLPLSFEFVVEKIHQNQEIYVNKFVLNRRQLGLYFLVRLQQSEETIFKHLSNSKNLLNTLWVV